MAGRPFTARASVQTSEKQRQLRHTLKPRVTVTRRCLRVYTILQAPHHILRLHMHSLNPHQTRNSIQCTLMAPIRPSLRSVLAALVPVALLLTAGSVWGSTGDARRRSATTASVYRRNLLQAEAATATPITAQTVFNLYGARDAQILPVILHWYAFLQGMRHSHRVPYGVYFVAPTLWPPHPVTVVRDLIGNILLGCRTRNQCFGPEHCREGVGGAHRLSRRQRRIQLADCHQPRSLLLPASLQLRNHRQCSSVGTGEGSICYQRWYPTGNNR